MGVPCIVLNNNKSGVLNGKAIAVVGCGRKDFLLCVCVFGLVFVCSSVKHEITT